MSDVLDSENSTDAHGSGAPAPTPDDRNAPNDMTSNNGPVFLEGVPEVDPAAGNLINAERAVRLRAVPFKIADDALHVAMVDTADFEAADELSVVAGKPVVRHAVGEDGFQELLRVAFGATAAQMAARLTAGDGASARDEVVANLEHIEADDIERMAEEPTLINLVNLIIIEAIRARASDIHVEPFERELIVKYRVDGVLRQQTSPPKHLQPAITSRLKIMAGMNIAERYVPQDGHITLKSAGRKVDIRVSTVPTIYGESVVMRVLDKDAISLDLTTLGMAEHQRDEMDRLIALPHGMVLVTGPTGSGKTTTLYAALTKLYDPSRKIITIEDPVEYELHGVNQMPVNPQRGLTFASGLRSILRQDPDVIMVGEIRDAETADIAVRAALTGHLIFSTLHTNDAVSAIGRLIDMGVEPFLLASVLEGAIAQRLGRRVCEKCRTQVPLTEAVEHRLSPDEMAMFAGRMSFVGNGCERCDETGFHSRIGFYEMLLVTSEMRTAVTDGRTSSQQLLETARADHVTMRHDGLVKASQGLTTPEEVLRATQDTDEPNGKPNDHPTGA